MSQLFGFPSGLSGGSKETSYDTNYQTNHQTDYTTSQNTDHTTTYNSSATVDAVQGPEASYFDLPDHYILYDKANSASMANAEPSWIWEHIFQPGNWQYPYTGDFLPMQWWYEPITNPISNAAYSSPTWMTFPNWGFLGLWQGFQYTTAGPHPMGGASGTYLGKAYSVYRWRMRVRHPSGYGPVPRRMAVSSSVSRSTFYSTSWNTPKTTSYNTFHPTSHITYG